MYVAKRKGHSWQFFPLYGMKITDDDGLTEPLFGDATLIGRDAVVQLVSERSVESGRGFLLHEPLAELLPDHQWSNVETKVSRDHILEIRPHSYVAVRRQGDSDGGGRADRVRAMLTASMFLRARRSTAFARESRQIAWSPSPNLIEIPDDRPVSARLQIVMNEHIINRPLVVTKADLRASWNTGSPIGNQDNLVWDIHRDHPVLKLLAANAKSTPRKRYLRSVALHLSDACCVPMYATQLQMSVTAIERLLGTSTFEELKRRAHAFLVGDTRTMFDGAIDARHKFVHQGVLPEDDELKQNAKNAITLAWLFLDIATAHLALAKSNEQYNLYLESQVALAKLADAMEQLAGEDSAAKIRTVAHDQLPEVRLTVRQD
jgi:hypothetical protein